VRNFLGVFKKRVKLKEILRIRRKIVKKVFFILAVFSLVLVSGCSSSSSDSDSGSGTFSGDISGSRTFKSARCYLVDGEEVELTLFFEGDSGTDNSINFNIDIPELPTVETIYTAADDELQYCEVEIDYDEDAYTGYSAEMDWYDDEDSWVTISKSGDEYTVEFSVYVSESDSFEDFDHFTGKYTGPVSVFNY